MTIQEIGSEQQLELGKDAFSHLFLSTIFSNELYTFEEHERKVNIGGRSITNLWFFDDYGALAEE